MRLYVTNLPVDTTDGDLTVLFAPFGEVVAASAWLADHTGRPDERVGFVVLSDGVEAAIAALDEVEYRGRPLRVTSVVPCECTKQNGGLLKGDWRPVAGQGSRTPGTGTRHHS